MGKATACKTHFIMFDWVSGLNDFARMFSACLTRVEVSLLVYDELVQNSSAEGKPRLHVKMKLLELPV